MQEWQKNLLALSIVPQIVLVKLLAQFPETVERLYSSGIYPLLSKVWRLVLGWIPFSVGDLLYTFLGIYAIRWLIKNRRKLLKTPLLWFRDILIVVSLVYAAFHIFWGINYYRLPLHQKLGIEAQYTTEELVAVIDSLTLRANAVHNQLSKSDTLMVALPFTKDDMLEMTTVGFEETSKTYPFLQLEVSSIKPSLYRWPLTYMGFGGYLNPLTQEAQVNTINLKHKMPTTASHEKAHQVGYAAENEANFIAYLTTINHPDAYFRFTGTIFGLKHCLRELQRRDRDLFDTKIDHINIGIRKHYREESLFWQRYQNPLEPLFKASYNQFLKANNQTKGIESYSYVVALIVNYEKAAK